MRQKLIDIPFLWSTLVRVVVSVELIMAGNDWNAHFNLSTDVKIILTQGHTLGTTN